MKPFYLLKRKGKTTCFQLFITEILKDLNKVHFVTDYTSPTESDNYLNLWTTKSVTLTQLHHTVWTEAWGGFGLTWLNKNKQLIFFNPYNKIQQQWQLIHNDTDDKAENDSSTSHWSKQQIRNQVATAMSVACGTTVDHKDIIYNVSFNFHRYQKASAPATDQNVEA